MLKTGAFKLWVNWIKLAHPHLGVRQHARRDALDVRLRAHGVAAQVAFLKKQRLETGFSLDRLKG
jgi:hypothetical protein